MYSLISIISTEYKHAGLFLILDNWLHVSSRNFSEKGQNCGEIG